MDGLNSIYGFNVFKLNHDLFTVNRKKVVEFCHAMLERNYTWSCSARVDCVDPDLLELMWQAGCRDMYFGIEAGSARMQAISRKRLDLDLVEPTLDITSRLGMRTVTSFITGYPEEEKEDQDSTLNLAARLLCRPGRLNEFTTSSHGARTGDATYRGIRQAALLRWVYHGLQLSLAGV